MPFEFRFCQNIVEIVQGSSVPRRAIFFEDTPEAAAETKNDLMEKMNRKPGKKDGGRYRR